MGQYMLTSGMGELPTSSYGVMGRHASHGPVLDDDALRAFLREHPHGNFAAQTVNDDGTMGDIIDLSKFAPQPAAVAEESPTEESPAEATTDYSEAGNTPTENNSNEQPTGDNPDDGGGEREGSTIHEHRQTDTTTHDDGHGNLTTDAHTEAKQNQE